MFFLYPDPNRTAVMVLTVICEGILPRTTILSNVWNSYVGIEKIPGMNYQHLTVNHSENFVDPDERAHTQRVESMWAVAKHRNRRQCVTR